MSSTCKCCAGGLRNDETLNYQWTPDTTKHHYGTRVERVVVSSPVQHSNVGLSPLQPIANTVAHSTIHHPPPDPPSGSLGLKVWVGSVVFTAGQPNL